MNLWFLMYTKCQPEFEAIVLIGAANRTGSFGACLLFAHTVYCILAHIREVRRLSMQNARSICNYIICDGQTAFR